MSWLRDVQFALRTVLRYPWTHGAATFILAIALAAVLCMLSIVDEILWSPLPGIERADRVAWLFPIRAGGDVDPNEDTLRLANAIHFRDHAQSLSHVAWFGGAQKVLLGGSEPELIGGFATSAEFFPMMKPAPLLGRLLAPSDAEPGAPKVVVLGEGFWRERFAKDPKLLGSTLNLDGVLHTVVGIAPERFFAQLGSPAQLWLPLTESAEAPQDRRTTRPVMARLADGVSYEAANAELERLSLNIAEAHPETDLGFAAKAVPLHETLARFRPLAFGLVIAATLVLGAAGAVAANLLLVQAAERSREQAIRQALGASVGALVGQWCLQVAVLMLLAIGLGTLLGQWSIDAILASMPSSLKANSFGTAVAGVSWRSWLGTVAIALAATPLIGLVPARQAASLTIGRTLRDGGGGAVGKARGRRARRVLIGLQLALASALTFGAVCAYVGFVVARESPLGFDPHDVSELTLPDLGADPAQRAQLFSRLERSTGLHLALASDPLLTRMYAQLSFFLEGTARPAPAALPWAKRNDVSPYYFEVLGIPLRAGRSFRAGDDVDAPCVAILSERLSLKTFGAEPSSALGQRLHVDAVRAALPAAGAASATAGEAASSATVTTCEVVGVVGEVKDALPNVSGDIYLSSAQWPPGGDTVYVHGASAEDLARLKAEARSLNARQVAWEKPLGEVVAVITWAPRILAGMFMTLALIGCSLAGLGTYAVLAHSAGVRRRELGLRAVLGARPRELAWLVVADNLTAGALGIVVGVVLVAAGMVAVGRYQPDAWVYPFSAALMACLLAGSALLSARGVWRLQPGLALRRR